MNIFTTVLVDFFQKHLPARLGQMAKIVIRNAQTAHQPNSVGYKVLPDRFQAFREEWERLLMQQMVLRLSVPGRLLGSAGRLAGEDQPRRLGLNAMRGNRPWQMARRRHPERFPAGAAA
jgi:hypothetical protein